MTHTPGPWIVQKISDLGHTFDIYSEFASTRVGAKYTDDPVALYVKYISNAALIAAAPDLLRQLKQARDAIASLPNDALGVGESDRSHWFIRDELLGNIDAEIAKAEPPQSLTD